MFKLGWIATLLVLWLIPGQPMAAGGGSVMPIVVGSAPNGALLTGLAVVGNYAYAPSGARLEVFGVADPTMPAHVGAYTATSTISDLVATPTHLYLATETAGVLALSLADPAHPQAVGAYAQVPNVQAIALSGNSLVIAVGNAGLRTLSLADPAHPAALGSIVWHDQNPSYDRNAIDVVTAGTLAYVTVALRRSSIFREIYIVDLAQPAHPVHVPQEYLDSGVETLHVVSAGMGYFISAGDGLLVADLRNPNAITITGRLNTQPLRQGQDLAFFGRYLYAATNDGVKVIDVSDPTAPSEAGAALPAITASAVVLHDSHVYVAGNGLFILSRGMDVPLRHYLPLLARF